MTPVIDVLDAAEQLRPMLQEHATEIEAARRLPPEVLAAVRGAGCFRILLPASYGGLGADLPAALSLYETLARADASTAWTVLIGSAAWLDLVGLPKPSFDALFTHEQGTIAAGVFNPTGSITRDGDAYRVTGRWSFASGCEHATWLYVNCLEHTNGDEPQFRIAVLTPDQMTIEDTWHVAGLRGTGSHHIHVDDAVVPAERTVVPFHDPPCINAPVTRLPIPAALALCIAGVALGIGQGALDDVVTLAPTKTPLLAHGPLATNPRFLDTIARIDTELRAARLLLQTAAATTWAAATDRRTATLDERGRLRAASAWIVERAEAAVDAAHRAAGGGAIYADHPLQRRLRDIQTLRQHFLVRPDTFGAAGAVIAGGEPDVPVF
ncbi:acyl-CoA dehydrogenase family protein [Desertimonas flava]|uniref:acyl-CoA dehydrogenase family protein n=1 Tax=Desertimonas flava TaxID=2064846 RepID=UPI0013C4955A|nr:acyl-CoA dehydrogenase family protein [Desertimonas flava]